MKSGVNAPVGAVAATAGIADTSSGPGVVEAFDLELDPPSCERGTGEKGFIFMSEKRVVSTDQAPPAIGPYSQAIVANGFVYTAGVIPLDPKTKEIVGTTIKEQAERVLTSLKALLEASGASLDSVIKTTCFLDNLGDFPQFNEVYASYFTGETAPARSTVEVAKLPMGVLVEVEAVAIVNE
jgi:2-iminobutanoate/2-iminopropanoate deaminase